MNKILTVAAALLLCTSLFAQQERPEQPERRFVSADEFPIYGKCVPETMSRYERFPESLKDIREGLRYLGQNSAGLYIRFRSNSTFIGARWTSRFQNLMNHMTPVGTRGLDLYILTDEGWRFVSSARPDTGNKTTTATIVEYMEPVEREYMMYLSLYDGIDDLDIWLDKDAYIEQPAVDSPKAGNQIVMYGTSILQGGCANRPGMVHTSIISRKLDKEVINLGFSGNAMLDLEIAHLMAQVEDPALFVLDYAPNAWDYLIDEKGEEFFRILRDAHPNVPVIFIEDPHFSHYRFDQRIRKEVDKKNAAQQRLWKKLTDKKEKLIYYIGWEGLAGDSSIDDEPWVDGIHFTDLGMVRYTEKVLPVIEKALKDGEKAKAKAAKAAAKEAKKAGKK